GRTRASKEDMRTCSILVCLCAFRGRSIEELCEVPVPHPLGRVPFEIVSRGSCAHGFQSSDWPRSRLVRAWGWPATRPERLPAGARWVYSSSRRAPDASGGAGRDGRALYEAVLA
ncbi:unnamed protein product, partial [Prorocentrum cordatum]